MEVEEFERINEIHQLEIEAGAYSTPSSKAFRDWRAEAAHREHLAKSRAAIQREKERLRDSGENWKILKSLMSFISNAQMFDWGGTGRNTSRYEYEDFHPDQGYTRYGRASTQKQDVARQWGGILAEMDLQKAINMLEAQAARAEASQQRELGLAEVRDWMAENAAFRLERYRVAFDLNRQKIEAMMKDGGSLNFLQQMDQQREVCEELFAAVVVRMRTIATALQTIYGERYVEPELGTTTDAVHKLATRLQFLQSYVNQKQVQEHNATVSLSIAKRIGGGRR